MKAPSAASKAASSAASPAASSAVWRSRRRRRRRRRRRPRRSASAATSSSRPRSKDVKPVYPPIAQSARVQGVVIIEATIGPDGRVQEAKVLRSIPLLDAAALDAVKQWAVHADAAQRRAGAGHHDGHRELHAAIDDRSDRSNRQTTSRLSDSCRWRMDRGFNGRCGSRWDRGQGRGLHALHHVDVVVRRRHRALLHLSRRRGTSRSCTRRRWPSTSRKAA